MTRSASASSFRSLPHRRHALFLDHNGDLNRRTELGKLEQYLLDDGKRFVDSLGEDGIAGTADDDLRLEVGSPCINTGDPGVVLTPREADLDGHARVLCDRVDMGAYEFGIGDYDCDFDVDLADFSSCFSRITGPAGGPYAEGCEACDFDYDLDVDLFDFTGFQAAFTLE